MGVRVEEGGGKVEFLFDFDPPGIYLDHCAIETLSKDERQRGRFMSYLQGKGTFLFSGIGLMEIMKRTGASLSRIRSFLAEIGERWLWMEFDPSTVIRNGAFHRAGDNAPFLERESIMRSYLPHVYGGPLTLSKAVDLVESGRDKLEPTFESMIETKVRSLQAERDHWKSDSEYRKAAFRLDLVEPEPRELAVYNRLIVVWLRSTYPISRNSLIDFYHAVTSTAYGNFVILDNHWAEMTRQANLPAGFANIYRQSEFERFFQDIERSAALPSNWPPP